MARRRPVRRAAGDRVRGGRRGERHRFCAALCGGRLSRGVVCRVAAASRCFSVPSRRHLGCRWLAASLPHRVGTRRHPSCISVIGRRPRRRWVARSCAVWRAIRRAHGDGAVAVRQLWRWRRRWRRCCFFPIASHSLLFCAGARRLLVGPRGQLCEMQERCDVPRCRDVRSKRSSPRNTSLARDVHASLCARRPRPSGCHRTRVVPSPPAAPPHRPQAGVRSGCSRN